MLKSLSPINSNNGFDATVWQERAACRGMDTELFYYPDGERGPRRKRRENAAKTICASCPVLQECKSFAIQISEPFGIWGGMTEDERIASLNRKEAKTFSNAS